ncbi:putative PurR-regulated permease PerM [Promicromonospora sp. AC04]|uniref:AI-2E family transporter n=1 Tax=Promicromonospora sp. AC04 TaxID=2135723 RepID=UPI000D3D644E|nr:AI-2E family transporter [Promicromonospora sp. AC04]PUB20209.1 putative PurR-regulated permease PerM [Promicromonospora sp. AC04]
MWWNRRKPPVETEPGPISEAGGSQEEVNTTPVHRTAYIMVGLGGAVVAAFGLAAIGEIFVWSFFALVLTICAYPLRARLEGYGLKRGVATFGVVFAVVLLLAAFFGALFVSFAQFLTLLPQYTDELRSWASDVGAWLTSIGLGQQQADEVSSWFDPDQVLGFIGGIVGSASGFVTAAVILLTMVMLMGMDSSFARPLVRGLYPSRPRLAIAGIAYTTGVRRYMVVTTLLGVAQGVVDWIALTLLGVPGAALWGLLAFLCSFIPNIGYFIAIVPPIVFGALVGGWPLVIAVIVVYGIVNAVIQSLVQPRVVGNAVQLSQSLTFFSVLFWAVVLGPMGAVLAIPLTLLVRMLLVDSNPGMTWVRPALGDIDAARKIMEVEDAAAKAERRSRRNPDGAAA